MPRAKVRADDSPENLTFDSIVSGTGTAEAINRRSRRGI